MVIICGDLEAEIAELEEEEREEFRKELGLEGSSLERLIEVGYEILYLVTFYTTVSSELRAWTVPKGTPAPKAAGKIHSGHGERVHSRRSHFLSRFRGLRL